MSACESKHDYIHRGTHVILASHRVQHTNKCVMLADGRRAGKEEYPRGKIKKNDHKNKPKNEELRNEPMVGVFFLQGL